MRVFNNKESILLQITGFVFFTYLFILSLVFYKERILCVDPAFYLFKLIENIDFVVEFGRWGSIPSQIPVLYAIQNNVSLEYLMKIYSGTFIIIYYLIFIIVTLILKSKKAGLAILLALCIYFRHAFYYSTTELYQGMCLALLVWAVIYPDQSRKQLHFKWIAAFIASVLIIVISYFHQITMFVVFFILLYEILKGKSLKDIHLFSIFIFTIGWFIVRIYFLSNTDYEKDKIIDWWQFLSQLQNVFQMPGTNFFHGYIQDNLFIFLIPVSITIFLMILFRKWVLMFFYVVYSIGYMLLVLITFSRGESPMVLENYFSVIGFFTAVPLVDLLLEKVKIKKALLFIIPILFINLISIYNAHFTLTKRIDYLNRIISNTRPLDGRKFMINNENFPWQYAWVKWTVPFETAILSSLKSPDSTMTIFIADHMDKYNSLIDEGNVFLGAEWNLKQFSSENLNNNYFRLPCSRYTKLSSFQNDSSFVDTLFSNGNISINPLCSKYYSDADTFIVAELEIINNTGIPLNSIPDKSGGTYLTYHLYDKKGNLLTWDGIRSLFEIDINNNYTQGLYLAVPKEEGEYIVEVDIITEGKRWWGINSRFDLVVDFFP